MFEKETIKYDDWKVLLTYFERESFKIPFDLKRDYQYIEIFDYDRDHIKVTRS